MDRKTILSELNKIYLEIGIINDSIIINEEMENKNFEKWDSLNHVVLISEIEQHFDLKFSFSEIAVLNTISSICNIIENKIQVED